MAEQRYTAEQLQVINHSGRHAVVSAVAGSGKTETMIGRLRHLLQRTAPQYVVVVMFNTAACADFKARFERRVGGVAPEIRTFNSMGNKIVNRLVELGHLPEARVSDREHERRKLAKDALTARFLAVHGAEESPPKELVDDFVTFIGLVKCGTESPEEVFERRPYQQAARIFPEAFRLYEARRGQLQIRFFEDQLYDPTMRLLAEPALQQLVANRVDHIIVDEAQDVSGIQVALLKILAGTRASVMIVGDEDQAIYEWRGANPDYITRGFEADFRDCTRYALPHTFRFGHALALAASQLISRNSNRNPKISIAAPGTPKTEIHTIGLPAKQPAFGRDIQRLIDSGVAPDEIAVLVRTYSLALSLELELHQLGVPYFVYGRPPLLRIAEITALIAVLQLAAGRWKELPEDAAEFMFRSLLSMPSLYFPASTLTRLTSEAMASPDRLSEIVRSAIVRSMHSYQVEQIADRADLLEIIATTTGGDAAPLEVLNLYLKGTRFEESIRKQASTPEQADTRMQNVHAFLQVAGRAHSIDAFLEDLDPLMDTSAASPPKDAHVWVGSVHRAKGAQWRCVFVPGLSAGAFPRRELTDEEMEAERRLCYVAITRAVEALYLVHPLDPDLTKSTEVVDPKLRWSPESPTSKFLWEMDLAVARHASRSLEDGRFRSVPVERPGIANGYFARFPVAAGWKYQLWTPPPAPAKEDSTASAAGSAFSPGQAIRHAVFGAGTVVEWLDSRVIKVRFLDGSTRMFIAEAAPLSAIGVAPAQLGQKYG